MASSFETFVGIPLLATALGDPHPSGVEHARGADRIGPEAIADRVERSRGRRVVGCIRRGVVERELAGRRAQVRGAHSEETEAGGSVSVRAPTLALRRRPATASASRTRWVRISLGKVVLETNVSCVPIETFDDELAGSRDNRGRYP